MVVVSADGCTDTVRSAITVHSRPQAAFIPTQVVQRQPETQVAFTNQSQGATIYAWDFGNSTTATDPNPVVDFQEPGTHPITFVAYNSFGCTGTARGLVIIEPGVDIFIPNVFTPNGDGINDEWNIRTNAIPYQVWVYDWWGNLVFEGNASRLWNGRYKNSGSDCPEGTYAYKLTVTFPDGKTFTRSGTVTLLR
jgi:gliding motility-associated-like protein